MARPKGSNGYTAQQFITAIPGTGGIITAIAKRVGCNWSTAQKYILNYPTVAAAWQDERESILDMGESSLFLKVKDGEAWAVKYLLSTLGKRRGYVERQELTGADGDAFEVSYIDYRVGITEAKE